MIKADDVARFAGRAGVCTLVCVLIGYQMRARPVSAQEGERSVYPVPSGPEEVVSGLSPFGSPPDSSRIVRTLQTVAPFPASDYDRVLIARMWQLAGEFDLSLASLSQVSSESDVADLARYELARTALSSGRITTVGLAAYWSSCGVVDARVRDEIYWDLLAAMTPTERSEWHDLPGGDAACAWLEEFWDQRAERMAITRAERIVLHYQRSWQARQEFYLQRPRHLRGVSDSYGRPQGIAVDDRGLLLVRLGLPDEDEACPEQVAVPPDSLPNRLGRCWIYESPAGYKIFYLTTKDRFKTTAGDGSTFGPQSWPDGDFRIQEDLGQQAEPGTLFFQKYVMNADLSPSVKADLVRRGAAYRLDRLRRDSVIHVTDLGDARERAMNRLETRSYNRRITVDARESTSAVLEEIPDTPAIDLTADLRFEVLRFLNPSQGAWHVWLLAAVPAAHLTVSSPAGDERPTLDVGGRFATTGESGVNVERLAPISVSASAIPKDAGLALRGIVEANPGPLPLTFVVEDLNNPGKGAWIRDTITIASIGGLPKVSDIAVAQAEGGTWTRDGETYLQVSPAHITNADGSIFTYFEVYGVRPGTRYEVELRLAPVDVADRIWRLELDDLSFRLQFASEMPGDIGRHNLRLDLSDTEPGGYTLAVRIQDEQSTAYSLPTVTDIFVAGR